MLPDDDDLQAPVESEAPVSDLRSTIEKAVETQRDPDAAPPALEPVDEAQEARAQRARDEAGRFAKEEKQERKPAPAAPQPQPQAVAAPQQAPAPQAPMQIAPPYGWSPAAKAAFDKLDPVIKEAVAKREEEVSAGFAKYEGFKDIAPYMEMAKANGANLSDALKIYTEVDRRYARDAVDGHTAVCENTGMDPRVLVAEWARRLGYHLVQADGSSPQFTQQDPQQQSAVQQDPRLASIESAVHALLSEREQQNLRGARQTVADFWAQPENKYAENVSDIMVSLINQARAEGRALTLKEAYDTACWSHPEVRDLLINERVMASTAGSDPNRRTAAATQARAAAKAVTGAPAGGVAPGGASPAPKTVREAVLGAYAQAQGRI